MNQTDITAGASVETIQVTLKESDKENPSSPIYLKKPNSSRINRQQYFLGLVLLKLIALLSGFAFSIIYDLSTDTDWEDVFFIVSIAVYSILCLCYIPSFLLRRAHDLGKKGSYLLWLLVPVVNIVVSLNLLLEPGQKHDNLYGSKPGPGLNLPVLFSLY